VGATVAHVYDYFRVRRIQTVISALSKLAIDRSIEADVVKAMPYLARCQRDVDVNPGGLDGDLESGLQRCYHVNVRSDLERWIEFESFAYHLGWIDNTPTDWNNWVTRAAGVLGYRYINFGASVILLNGKVSSVRYGIADHLIFPEVLGDVVSVKSVHSYWNVYQRGASASSASDESPDFRVGGGDDWGINVLFTPGVSPVLKAHAFSLNLSCFWGLRRCYAHRVAALAWQDKARIEAAALKRLKSNDPCPARVLAGRMKYFPDLDVLLLKSTGYENKTVNVEGSFETETWTHYRLASVLRGHASNSWDSVRDDTPIPHPMDSSRNLPDPNVQGALAGQDVLAFSGPRFDSCRMVFATPSAFGAVQSVPIPARREEDRPPGAIH
jgi:hypothetical protein